MNELKQKRLPTFGTVLERKERLKKYYGKSIRIIHTEIGINLPFVS